ncbi:BREX system Lon protease-like protein BrxL [Dictyoglomus thermophilum]|uniref:BREX system Lon protease-like protein BrxL n=1 Tax=Dictyoglomus thermophilum TaxID=14 RepID=UPI001CA41EF7|nr:BREX system Lon protease-like protein BrxL [Dictyoglomus thermophilum]
MMENNLDKKIKEAFPDESVYKVEENYSVFTGKNLPSFIKDWLVKKFTDEDGVLNKEELLAYMEKFIPQKGSVERLKGEIMSSKTSYNVLARALIEPDVKKDIFRFSLPELGIKPNEGIVASFLVEKYKELKGGELWGIFNLVYPYYDEGHNTYIGMIDYKPFKPYEADLDYFREGREKFTLEEWVDLLIRSMEYNPEGFDSLDQKLLFLSRLLIFVEPRLNMIELAPKGTGKTYIFSNLSKYGWWVGGGIITRAKMFYDISRNTPGFITKYDFVALDEIQTIKFSDEQELKGALKDYLEYGKFTVANIQQTSNAGVILLGNITLNKDKIPINSIYLSELPNFFHESALLDRFHGFIEGWKLPRMREDMKVRGYTLNVEYFTEILHTLRERSEFSAIVDDLLDIPRTADTRDTTAIKRLATAYLKLLFPHIRKTSDVDKDEFERYCLNPAIEKRAIIKKQAHLMDPEFKEEVPDIKVARENV